MPSSLLKEVLKKDIIVAYEVYSGGVSDTEQRSQLCDLLLKHIGLPSWPLYGDSEEYKDKFKKSLIDAALKHNIEVEL